MAEIVDEAQASFLLEEQAALVGELTDVPALVEPAVEPVAEVPAISWRRRVVAVMAISGALLGTACEAPSVESAGRTLPSVSASPSTVPAGQLHKGGPEQTRQHFEIYPITLDAKGFEPATYPQGVIEQRVRDGWLRLSSATGGLITNNVTVRLEPTTKLSVPDVTSVPNLCDDKTRGDFNTGLRNAFKSAKHLEDKDMDQTVGLDRTTKIIVLEQTKGSPCYAAVAGPGFGMIVYDGNDFGPWGYLHEDGHLVNVGHDSKMQCKGVSFIDSTCKVDEYGSQYTIMGGSFDGTDPDPFTGFALKNLGVISPDEIQNIADGQSMVTLQALQNMGAGTKLVYIPMLGLQGKDQPEALKCADGFYLELSGGNWRNDESGLKWTPVSLKAYVVNSRTGLPHTFLLPWSQYGPLHSEYFRSDSISEYAVGNRRYPATIKVGNLAVSVQMLSLEQGGPKADATGTTTFSITASHFDVPKIAVPNCSGKG